MKLSLFLVVYDTVLIVDGLVSDTKGLGLTTLITMLDYHELDISDCKTIILSIGYNDLEMDDRFFQLVYKKVIESCHDSHKEECHLKTDK